MPETPTPGEIAYIAWWTAFGAGRHDPPYTDTWPQLTPRAQAAWDAAAQAVREMEPLQEPRIPTCRWCGQPVAAHPHGDLQWRCRLSDGPLLPKDDAHA